MLSQFKNPRLYGLLLLESVIFGMAYVQAHLLRFEFILTSRELDQILLVLPWIIPVKAVIFFVYGLYRGMWRYSSLYDFWRLAQACFFSSFVVMAIVLLLYRFNGFSRAVFLLDGILTFVMTGGLRMLIRTWYNRNAPLRVAQLFRLSCAKAEQMCPKRVLIIGAGGSGEKLLREIYDSPHLIYQVVGFLDDDPGKKGRAVHGVPIFGPVEFLSRILEKHPVDEVLISTPSATGPQMRRIVDTCKASRVRYKTLPAISQIIDDKVSIKALRDVHYEDLLRRPPVELDLLGIQDILADRKVMVTGAGGSIGSELCRQLVRFKPKRLILVDAGEANLYEIHMGLRHELSFDACNAVLAKIQNRKITEEIFQTYQPDVVFHAAAYKHVPLLERNPWEAVFNNVLGSHVVMDMAARYGVGRFVLVSTDKAVRPTNVMGGTKRLAELILQSYQGNGTQFMAVRFGNVLASSGSVIPLFLKQIEQGGPVTVTHPEITRYFMMIPEAAQLILQAAALGKGGEIFVLEMGTPVKIAEMAKDLIRLSGKEPGRDIKVAFTGLRPGEKLYEELITQGEDIVQTPHKKIMMLHCNGRWNWNGMKTQECFQQWLHQELNELYRIAGTHDPCAIKGKLKELVPEYMPQEAECVLNTRPYFQEHPTDKWRNERQSSPWGTEPLFPPFPVKRGTAT